MTGFEKFCAIFIAVVLLILSCGIGYKIGHGVGYRKGYDDALNLPHKPDTVTIIDTHYVDKPIEKIKWKDKVVLVPITDTVSIHDTTYISLQFEKVQYGDSTYTAVVSGYEPSLDWIEVYNKTQYITNTVVVKKKWSFSVTAGPGLVWNQNGFHGGVGVMGGLSYNF